jgi:hypothetical protein
MGRKMPLQELEAGTAANGYQGGAHQEEDSRRDGNKHGDTTKKTKDATLDHYMM